MIPTKPENLKQMVKYHTEASRKYGKLDSYERIMLKRTINSSFFILENVEIVTFEQLELAIYLKTNDPDMLQFIKLYEFQLEEAKLNPERFIHNLHGFFMKTGFLILEKNIRNFFDFTDFVFRKSREKVGYKSIFDAYLSLLMQQFTYLGFLKGLKEKICCGITTENELIFKDDIYPFGDCASYDLEKELYDQLVYGKNISFSLIKATYSKYGIEVNRIHDIEYIDATSRIYVNNHFALLAYINEHTMNILPDKVFNHSLVQLPRQWEKTEVYEELLTRRKYVLPSDGITAVYFNAGEISKIQFQEIYKHERIVLLYKVYSSTNGEFSGYYDTKTHDFYSIFERTNFEEADKKLKNFILENYCLLTCEVDTERKKLSVLKQVEDINKIDSFYGKQPVVCYMFRKSSSKNTEQVPSLRHYDRNNYQSEKKSINGFIRRLPVGQSASDEAKQFAVSLGYELGADETYVRPFEKHVLKIRDVD